MNRFRSTRIRPVFEQVFTGVVLLLADAGMIDLDTYFLDGTKIEANAGKFTFVWGSRPTATRRSCAPRCTPISRRSTS